MISKADKKYRSIYLKNEINLNILIASWNVGNEPPNDLSSWLSPINKDLFQNLSSNTLDLCIISGQEVQYKARELYDNCSDDWLDQFNQYYPAEDYELLSYESLRQIRIIIYCRKALVKYISAIDVHTESTGILGVFLIKVV